MALAVSIHATDVQPAIIRGARSLALSLFSWLTPLLALISLAFLIALPFVSLQPLWHTHFATSLLLSVAVTLIFLINCCYQDGAVESTTAKLKQVAGTLGAIELVPLATLSAWGLSMRVTQYGWSVQRVMAAAVALIVCCYTIGYASSVVRSQTWLKRLETTNWLTAYVVLTAILALFSPLADPARLMVADQIARFKAGLTSPEKLDFVALRFDGGRWGKAALDDFLSGRLTSDPAVHARVQRVLAATNRIQAQQPSTAPLPDDWTRYVPVYPTGRTLPPSFLQPDFAARYGIAWNTCVSGEHFVGPCAARYVTLAPEASEAIVLVTPFKASVFEQDSHGEWHNTGDLNGPRGCSYRAITSATLTLAPHPLPDVVVDGRRLTLLPVVPPGISAPCP